MSSLIQQIRVERTGVSKRPWREIYFTILKMPWSQFLALVCAVYIGLNFLFAGIFLLGGDSILNARPGSFFDAFIFSNQSFATIGYGYYLPKTDFAHLVVVIESITSIIFTSIITGLTFAKFARPTTHIIFSDKAIIADFDGHPTLMFRLGNGRETNLVDAKISVVTLVPHQSKEGHKMQRFTELKPERDRSPFFILTWTVMHKIDKDSPFYGFSANDFVAKDTSLIVSLSGFDETYGQTVHTSWRYQAKDIRFAKKFHDVVEMLPNGGRRINFHKFHEIELS